MSSDPTKVRPLGKGRDTAEGVDKGRRTVLTIGALAGAWLLGSLYPILKYLSPQAAPDPFAKEGRAPVEGITLADLQGPGMGKNGSYAGHGLILYRAADNRLRAFDSKCTHAGCNVAFQGNKFFCNCHGGTYDLDGKNIAGPPPRPLTELKVMEESGKLYVAPMSAKG